MQAMGGAVAAVESGYMKSELVASHAERRRRIEAGEDIVVGVNKFTTTEPNPLTSDVEGSILVVDHQVEQHAIDAIRAWRAGPRRDGRRRGAARAARRRQDRREPDGRRRWRAPGPA